MSWKKVLVQDANIQVGTINATLDDNATDATLGGTFHLVTVANDGASNQALTTRSFVLGNNAFNSTSFIDGNETITLSGDVTGSGTTSISVTIQDNAVETAMITNDAVNGDKIADDAIGSEHIADNAVLTAAISNDAVNGDKIADDSIGSEHIADNAVLTAAISNDAVNGDKIADDSIGSEHIADNAVLTAAISNDAVNGDKIADDSIGSEHIADNAVLTAAISNDAINGDKIADDAIASEHIADNAVLTAAISNDAVNGDKIADDSIGSEHIADNAVLTAAISNSNVTLAKIQNIGASTVLGNAGAGDAAPSALSIDTDLSSVSSSDDTLASAKAIKSYVDTQVASGYDLDFSGDSGTGTITNAETFAVTGTANQITTTASGNGLTIAFVNDVTMPNNLTVTGNLTVSGTQTTINTAELTVDDKVIEVASVAVPTTSTGTESGIRVATGATTVDPRLNWNKDGKLANWELYDRSTSGTYATEANKAGYISVMKFTNAAPTLAPAGGAGSFGYDENANELYVYLS